MKKSIRLSLIIVLLSAAALCAAEGNGGDATESTGSPYGVLSILPPILAIALAIITRQVFVALFFGILLGAFFLNDYNLITAFMRVLDKYFINAMANPDHAAIILFSMCLGGIIRVISNTGGLHAIVASLAGRAKNAGLCQVYTWLMGCLVFIDDYANTLLVGNTMRPFSDKLRISREKLAYIVDSTAAPVTALVPLSTWLSFELGLIQKAFNIEGIEKAAYPIFLNSIPYRFYGIFAIFFVLFIALSKRDFGSMLKAERRARRTGKVLDDNATPMIDREVTDIERFKVDRPHWLDAVVPIATVIIVLIAGLYHSGVNALEAMSPPGTAFTIHQIIAEANAYHALMWASFSGAFVAIVMALRTLSLKKALDAYLTGLKSMVLAMIVLVLAWSIGDVCEELDTARYCVAMTSHVLTPYLVPLVVFVIAAFVAFATGTSWGTMTILIPIVVPLAWKLSHAAGVSAETGEAIFMASIASVLSGATFGDHCSPISDTTVMSSMASACDHIDHVKTQIPYALLVAFVAMLAGYLPAGFGISPWLCLPAGLLVLIILLFVIGKNPDSPAKPDK